MLSGTDQSTPAGAVPVPLWMRLPIAVVLTVYAARTNRRWLLVVATTLALPVLWYGGLTMLAGIVALQRRQLEDALMRLVAGTRISRREGDMRQEPLPGG